MRRRISKTAEVGLHDRLPIQRHLHGLAYPDVIEGRFVDIVETKSVVRAKFDVPHIEVGIGLAQVLDLIDVSHLRVAGSREHVHLP